ncbi:uncharacterized protein SOCE26_095680 [Sorangium cellulosum]|uniref:AMP-dependent ligase C-terminal domain-containing protein n=1 Tax=Sorangium cellulosum TaxID=56 RepID=A0A2L0F963_SORCE|nr:phenylacetate--CoA ligase family protein [Sorangium cellulosum]AUX48042.1 uncharacterized protein SOCE26_095680 [Sorangium cellulosum]
MACASARPSKSCERPGELYEDIWGCPALAYYGSLECGPIGVECTFQDGYHLAEGHVYVEIVDPDTGRVLPPGTVGELCVTVLYRRAAPLIRYRVGDLGYVETAPCPCCVERKRLVLRGRQGDQIQLGERSYSPYHVEEMLYRIPEVGNNYRLLVDRDGLTVEVELRPGSGDPARVAEKIRSRLDCHFGAVKAVVPKDRIERSGGKTTRVSYQYGRGDHT